MAAVLHPAGLRERFRDIRNRDIRLSIEGRGPNDSDSLRQELFSPPSAEAASGAGVAGGFARGASTAGANTLSERGSQQQSVRTRTDAGAGSFPHKFPDSGDHERELCALEESELLRRAKAIGVPQTECALALDSSTPKRRIVALIISAEEKAATVATGTAENESLNESLEVSV